LTIVQTGRLTATETGHRNQISAAMPGDGTQLGVVQGGQSGLVLTKTSGMGWQLDLGRCEIAPATPANGAVVATVTVAETGTFANGDATRDRIDVVGLQIDETATIANGNPPVKSVIIQGAYPVSGQPVTPTIPAGTIGLWSVRINAGTSSGSGGWNTANLVDLRPWLGQMTRAWRFDRSSGTDANFTTAMTGLIQGTITNAPAGTYLITGQSALYSTGGAGGYIYVKGGPVASPTVEKRRHTIVAGTNPTSPIATLDYVHAGGDLYLEVGYDVSSGTATVCAAPASGVTTVQAKYLGR